MKNIAPKDIAIKNIVNKVDDLISYTKDFIKSGKAHAPVFLAENDTLSNRFNEIVSATEQIKLLGYLTDVQFNKIKGYFYIRNESVENDLLGISTDFLNAKTKGHIADVVEGIFSQSDENLFIDRMYLLKTELRKCLSKEEKSKDQITGLKQPVIWENITFILKGIEVEVRQDDKNLGDHHLYDLGFPKVKNRADQKRNVVNFFISLFFSEKPELLDSRDNNNQKLKSTLSKILTGVFGTHKDPIEIDREKIYKARFITKFGGDLRVNNHSSGKNLTEQDEYTQYKNSL